ncbi:MAG: site-specific integrase [Deltaproteobacteria bacterium]|nr:site-specific integrase [Deltaproteobacteria bacterium]
MGVKVRQRNGKWWVFIDYQGKRKAKCIGDSLKTAKLFAEKMQAALLLGQYDLTKTEQSRPFDTAFTTWLDLYARVHCKLSTVTGYELAFRRYLLPALGKKDVRAITRNDVQLLVHDLLAKKLAPNSIRALLAPLREFFNHQMDDGFLDRNPCVRFLPRGRKEGAREQKVSFLTKEECGVLLRTAREQFPRVYPFISLLIRTGLRLGEAIALQWGDLDAQSRFLTVQRNWVDGQLTTPKSGKSRRVDVSLSLLDTLNSLLVERKKEALRHGWGEVPPWIFLTDGGTRLDPDNFRGRIWPKLLAKAGLRHIRIHDLRHSFASLLLENGESLAYIRDQLGHSSIKITVDTYGHLVPGGNRAAVDRLDGLERTTFHNTDATGPSDSVGAQRLTRENDTESLTARRA